MTEPTIQCPSCKTEIKLTESLAGPLLEQTRREFAQQLSAKDQLVAQAQEQVTTEKQRLDQERQSIEATIAQRLDDERKQIAIEEAARAQRRVALDVEGKDRQLTELTELLKAREQKLAEAQAQEAELLKKQRALDDEKRALALSVERQVNEALDVVRAKAKLEAEEALALKVKEGETRIASMQQTIEELKRKAEQGSQQLQGEAQELVLKTLCARASRSTFSNRSAKASSGATFCNAWSTQAVRSAARFCGRASGRALGVTAGCRS